MGTVTNEQFTALLIQLCAAFDKEPSVALLLAYQNALDDLAPGELAIAVRRATRELKFFPKPAELRELAGHNDPVKLGAALAWEAAVEAVRKHGYYGSVDIGPLVNAVIRNLGGWIRFSEAKLDEWMRKRFEEIYELFAHSRGRLNGAPLIGVFKEKPVAIAFGGLKPARELGPRAEVRRLAEVKS